MNENNELIMHVYKTAEMGVYTTKSLLGYIKNKENKIKHVLECELKEYEDFMIKSKEILESDEVKPEGNSIMSKMGSDMGIMMETMKDNSDPALAAMIIEGMTMGVVEMEAKIKSYKSTCKKEILDIARNFLVFQQNEIEKLKSFMWSKGKS